jgi:WD40 repeat protein
VRLWDCADWRELRTLQHSRPTGVDSVSIWGVAFSPDGTTLASASWDGTVKLWDVDTGQELSTIRGHVDPVKSVAFSPDGKRLATASMDGTVKLWRLPVEQQPPELATAGQVQMASASADGRTILTITTSDAVQWWDAAQGKELPLDAALGDKILSLPAVTLSPDGKIMAVRIRDGVPALEDPSAGPAGEPTHPEPAVYSRDGRRLAMIGTTGAAVTVWDMETVRELHAFPSRNSGKIRAIAFSPDGRNLATAGEEKDQDHSLGVVRFWDLATGQESLPALTGHRGRVTSVAFSADGKTLATGHPDGMVKLWDLATGQEKVTLKPKAGAIVCVAFSEDDRTLAIVTQPLEGPGRIQFWRAATDTEVSQYKQRIQAVNEQPLGMR